MKKSTTRPLYAAAFGAALAALAGCDVCADVDERICKDLGAEDCAIWKENGLTFSDQVAQSQGGGRRSGLKRLFFGAGGDVCNAATNDAAYPQILSGFKQAVAAMRTAKRAEAAAHAN